MENTSSNNENFLNLEIFIITLQKTNELSKKRTSVLINTLKDLGFDIDKIRYVGVDGSKLISKKIINKKYISCEKYDFLNHMGTLGDTLSHAIILRFIEIKKMYDKEILVLEEEACLNANFKTFLETTQRPEN